MHSPHALPEDIREFHQRSRQIGRAGYIRRLEILRHYNIEDRLCQIEAHSLFLAGSHDKLVPAVEEARLMGSRVPNSTVQILEGYGHICLINHDLDLLDYVGPWYDGVCSKLRAGEFNRVAAAAFKGNGHPGSSPC